MILRQRACVKLQFSQSAKKGGDSAQGEGFDTIPPPLRGTSLCTREAYTSSTASGPPSPQGEGLDTSSTASGPPSPQGEGDLSLRPYGAPPSSEGGLDTSSASLHSAPSPQGEGLYLITLHCYLLPEIKKEERSCEALLFVFAGLAVGVFCLPQQANDLDRFLRRHARHKKHFSRSARPSRQWRRQSALGVRAQCKPSSKKVRRLFSNAKHLFHRAGVGEFGGAFPGDGPL